jgi:hypothetical protein
MMPDWLKIVMDVVPVFTEWLKWVITSSDEEWEEISKAWPAPTKTRLAKIRYESKRDKKFGGGS